MRIHLGRVAALALAGSLSLAAGTAQAQYPERPITLIVPWGAGGGTDATGRIIGSLLEEELGQPVNVVNRTGGSGVVGHSAIATAAPDGYTLGVVLAGRETRTLPVAVYNALSFEQVSWGPLAAAALIVTLPVLVLTAFVQREIVGGLSAGAIKGG